MGRDTTIDWLPHYREVLVANAVRAVRDYMPAVQVFAARRRAWLAVGERDWRAAAIAAGAVPDHAITP